MEQWFYQLLGPGAVEIFANKQWNNGFINFFRGSSSLRTHIPYHCLLLVPATGANIPGLGDTKNPGSPKPGTE
nr:MAG: hypothetical protein [Bacteriophage sp.]